MTLPEQINPASLAKYWATLHDAPNDIRIALKSIDGLVSKLKPARLLERPTLVHMLATPGSGKSTIAERIIAHSEHRGFFHLGFDRVMNSLEPFQIDVAAIGKKAASARWEKPARVAGYDLLGEAIDARAPILFDHTGHDENHVKLLLDAQRKGFQVVMIQPRTSLETALHRVEIRNQQPGGHFVSEDVVRERYELIEHLKRQYTKHFPIIEIPNEGSIESLDISPALKALARAKHILR